MSEGSVIPGDGVAAISRGDLLVVVYSAASTVERTRWAFERAEDAVKRHPAGIIALMVVLASSRPPDQANRAQLEAGYKRMGSQLRLNITVPEGNPFHRSVVRLVLNTAFMLSGRTASHRVVDNVQEAVRAVRAAASPATPTDEQIMRDLAAVRAVLASGA